MICTVCVEYTENAQDNNIIIMILPKPWPTHVQLDSTQQTLKCVSGLDIRLVDAVARGASRFENLLAPQKLTGPPKN